MKTVDRRFLEHPGIVRNWLISLFNGEVHCSDLVSNNVRDPWDILVAVPAVSCSASAGGWGQCILFLGPPPGPKKQLHGNSERQPENNECWGL